MTFIPAGPTIIVTMHEPKYWWDSNSWVDDDIWWDEQDMNRIEQSLPTDDLCGSYLFIFLHGSGMYKLLPQGVAWPLENEETVLRDFIYGLSLSLDRLADEAAENLSLILPGDAGKYLSDWEQFLGLPKCPDIEQNLQQRAATVLAMWNISPYSNEQFYIDMAANFGYKISIEGGTRGADRDVFNLTVFINNPGNATYFRAGASSAGDRLTEYDFGPVECLMNFFKQAHNYLLYEERWPDAEPEDPSTSLTAALISGTYVAN